MPKEDETWIQYEDDKLMYKEKLCPFVRHAFFECFCVKEHKNEDDEDDDSNASNTTSSNNEILGASGTPFRGGETPSSTPPHLRKKNKQTTRRIESNHEPNSYSINIEVKEDYIDRVNKNNLQLIYLHRDEHEDALASFIHQMIQIEEHISNIC